MKAADFDKKFYEDKEDIIERVEGCCWKIASILPASTQTTNNDY
jgi:hypothetical protein